MAELDEEIRKRKNLQDQQIREAKAAIDKEFEAVKEDVRKDAAERASGCTSSIYCSPCQGYFCEILEKITKNSTCHQNGRPAVFHFFGAEKLKSAPSILFPPSRTCIKKWTKWKVGN